MPEDCDELSFSFIQFSFWNKISACNRGLMSNICFTPLNEYACITKSCGTYNFKSCKRRRKWCTFWKFIQGTLWQVAPTLQWLIRWCIRVMLLRPVSHKNINKTQHSVCPSEFGLFLIWNPSETCIPAWHSDCWHLTFTRSPIPLFVKLSPLSH